MKVTIIGPGTVGMVIAHLLGLRDVCLSLPVVVGKGGIERIFQPALDDREVHAFREAVAAVRRVIDQGDLPTPP